MLNSINPCIRIRSSSPAASGSHGAAPTARVASAIRPAGPSYCSRAMARARPGPDAVSSGKRRGRQCPLARMAPMPARHCLPATGRQMDVRHHREAEHVGRTVEIAKRITHRRRLPNASPRLKPMCPDNASPQSPGHYRNEEISACHALRPGVQESRPPGRPGSTFSERSRAILDYGSRRR